jgi:hypothetical protein
MSNNQRKLRKGRQPGASQWWYGKLRAEVRADRELRGEPPDLAEDEVLAWADAFFARTGDWPMHSSGPIVEAPGETWLLVAAALALGIRGFPRGGSIPRFLEEHRGRYNMADQKFTVGQILDWADTWHARTGCWPARFAGAIPGAGGVHWEIVNQSLRKGRGVLPGGSSLRHLLAIERGVFAPYSEEEILAWADAYRARAGHWPTYNSGPIAEAPGETWLSVQSALKTGTRGLPGGSSLARLLIKGRGMRSGRYLPPLTIPQVLAWADAHHKTTGQWPTTRSGPIPQAPGETWKAVGSALGQGLRGFQGRSTLTKLLMQHRGTKSKRYLAPLSITQILGWADAFHARTGGWPKERSGQIAEAPGETWCNISRALRKGSRGLPGGSSLFRLRPRERNAHRAGKTGVARRG